MIQNVLFDRSDRKVKGINRNPLPFEREIKLPFDISLTKIIESISGNLIQKVNENNEQLFKDDIVIDEITGEESWVEVVTPQKVTAYETVTNTYRVQTGETYHDEIVTEYVVVGTQDVEVTYTNELGETVTEIQQQNIVEEQTKTIQVADPVYEDITTTSEIPLETVDLEPIMVEEIVNKNISLEDSYFDFTADEVTDAKIRSLDENSLKSVVYFNEEMDVSGFTIDNCSSGNGFLVLHGNGIAVSHTIPLYKSTNTIEVYLESQPDIKVFGSVDNINFVEMINDKIKFDTPVAEVFIKLVNTATKNREVYCIGVLS